MPRYFERITVDEFRNKLQTTAISYFKREEEYDDHVKGWFSNGDWLWRTPWCEVNETIIKDLSKIRFYPENWSTEEPGVPLVGITTLPNGMPCLGVLGFGDGEIGVFCALYWDGKKIRGYVPENGNVFNPKTRAAWYDMSDESNEDDDTKALREMGYEIADGDDYYDIVSNLQYDCDAMANDIATRIIEKSPA